MDLALDTIIAKRYRVLGELGRGGMGVVYRVEHVNTGHQLALKVLSSRTGLSAEALERFKRESRAPARIKSDHVVTITDADVIEENGGMPFYVMELLDGTDLEHEIARRGRLPPADVVAIFAQLARVLDKAHAMGIVHRDLKPENLFLHRRDTGEPVLKLLDFGISKVVSVEEGGSLTGAGSLIGTPLYMSPEQASSGGHEISAATDVFSLGLVAIRMLTGEHYYRKLAIPEIMAQLLRDPPYPPSERWPWLTLAFDAWLVKSLAKDPAARFASVSDQARALAEALVTVQAPVVVEVRDASGASASPLLTTTMAGSDDGVTVTHREVAPRHRSRRLAVFAAALVIVSALGATRFVVSHRKQSDASVGIGAASPGPPLSPPPSVEPSIAPLAPPPPPETKASAEPKTRSKRERPPIRPATSHSMRPAPTHDPVAP
jgi:serine/threonine protein kinase